MTVEFPMPVWHCFISLPK